MTKILLVEDDKNLREIYGVRLLAEGYDIVSAGDGEEALAMAIKERPNLIVSDVMMPKISGFDMLDILRSTTETKDIKVIMMTALSSEDQRLRGEKLGADRYLVKSQVGIEDVVRTVHEVLGDLPNMTPAAPTPQADAATPVQAPSPAPVAPPTPQPPVAAAPVAQPSAPVSAPVADASTASSLPQPTAPFSSATPRPSGLGDRVIQPLPQDDQSTDVAAMLENELSGTPIPAHLTQPVASPAAPQQPIPAAPPTPQPAVPIATPIGEPTLPVPPQPVVPAPTAQPEPSVNRPDVASLSPQPLAPSPAAPVIPNALPHAPVGPSMPVETAAPAAPDPLQPATPPATDQ